MAAEAPTEVLAEAGAERAAPVAAPPTTPQSSPPAAEGKGKGGKEKKGKGKKDAKAKAPAASADGPSVAAHPRAARGVARAKAWSGLAGFVLGAYLSLPTNTLAGAIGRGLAAGVVCYVAAWAGAVFVWRRLVVLEVKGREQQLLMAAEAAAAAPEQPAAAAGRAGMRQGP
ncbi:MAG TPA: hypothetical protein VN772_00630 [Solirubrobacteraceae bacterium]|nr:hypothetical protein [Solirubrobacteraceae bacterium]